MLLFISKEIFYGNSFLGFLAKTMVGLVLIFSFCLDWIFSDSASFRRKKSIQVSFLSVIFG